MKPLNAWPERCLLLLLLLVMPVWAHAYPASTHQTLTFLAARLFNQCAQEAGEAPLTAMQVRFLARATADMVDRSAFVRMFHWNYYAPPGYPGRLLGGLVDTRFNARYENLVAALDTDGSEIDRLEAHGAVNFYLHHVTTPQRVVPVYTNRPWRLSFADRFDAVEPDEARLLRYLGQPCSLVRGDAPDLNALLHRIALETRTSVREGIPGMQVSWEVFWRFARIDGAFGDYGAAGNSFGREVEFDCGQSGRCILLEGVSD